MKDIYYQLANDFCENHCIYKDDNNKHESKTGNCENCQVGIFGEWLDKNVKQEKNTTLHIKEIKNLTLQEDS